MLPNEQAVANKKCLQADPRKPERPEGEAGANWAQCRTCGRGAHKLKLIRHTKHCISGDIPDCRASSK